MDFPTPNLSLDDIDAILRAEAPPGLDQLIGVALDAKNYHLYRKIVMDIFKQLEDQDLKTISRDGIGEIIQDNVYSLVRRSGGR